MTHTQVVRAVEHTAVSITTTIDHVAITLGSSNKHARTIKVLGNECLWCLRTEVAKEDHQGVAALLLYLSDSLEHIFLILNCSLAVENFSFVFFYDVFTALSRKRDRETVTAYGDNTQLDLWNVRTYHNSIVFVYL